MVNNAEHILRETLDAMLYIRNEQIWQMIETTTIEEYITELVKITYLENSGI